jgi:hypothetical protein
MSALLKVSASLRSSALFKPDPPNYRPAVWVEPEQYAQRDKLPAQPVLQAVGQRLVSHFAARRAQRSPDREASVRRRRMLGGSCPMPHTIRANYTEGERSALNIVVQAVRSKGFCDLPIDTIAAEGAVSRSTVKNALGAARALGHVAIQFRPRKGRKNLTNVVRIIAPEWIAWLKHGGRAEPRAALPPSNSSPAVESIGVKPVTPTKKQSSETVVRDASKAAKTLGEEGRWRRLRPDMRGSGT